ncbi:TlpA family protein disulfide reductase [Plantactinospora soyae]|uniref:Thiol-disulfide isomerase/thioredoxin n=1 Tax=Plantactinospora soyae TaxID=1544732 RepID=A0A927M1W7_9ACTN|nr:TlpA disulfide reductase family protein [Plantactinospora soyae]MBE1486489.1 thiol-disulfide isomerase/thioredoxin [Plantactinospora soyae]
MKRLLLAGSLVPLLLLAAGCTGSDPDSEAGPVPAGQTTGTTAFADCGTLTAPLPAPTPTDTAEAAGPGEALPALTLPCLAGDSRVAIGELRGPAVINLWAHWCAPCRKELPAFQRLSERTSGTLRVLGVNARDSRSRAESIGEDFGLRFPTLFDPDDRLRVALGRNVLPITLFVDGEGRIRHRDETGALDDAELANLVRQHLGVAVSS